MSRIQRPSSWSDDRQRVLEATDIVRLVEEHVALKRKGREYLGKCPFHDDHKPSMYVVPAKQIYHCFSCGAGGNAIDFVVNFHKMEFLDALKHLAERASIELTPRSRQGGPAQPESGQPSIDKKAMLEACAFALEFFRAILRHPEHGAEARATLEKRGISQEMVETFGIGAAPDRWDGLLLTMEKKGLSAQTLRAAGLLKARETGEGSGGGHYDAFRRRLMFPIHDLLGRPIAFGGRKLREEDEPKYINSPESALFDKSRTLFALPQAQKAIQEARRAIVVEGYIDAIACHQAGVRNVVATLGTALTPEHARILQRVCDEVVLLFDGDEAGARAADRALEVFFSHPIDVKIATLASAGAKDPDELLKQEGGREKFEQAITNASDALEYRFARLRERLGSAGLSARARLVEEDIGRLAELGLERISPIRRQLVVRRLASIAGTPESAILETLQRSRASARREPPAPEHAAETESQAAGAELARSSVGHALGALLAEPALWGEIGEAEREMLQSGAYAVGPALGTIARAAQEMALVGQTPSLTTLQAGLEDAESRRIAAMLAAHIDRVTGGVIGQIRQTLRDSINDIALATQRLAPPPEGDDHAQAIQRLRASRERLGRAATVIPRPEPQIATG